MTYGLPRKIKTWNQLRFLYCIIALLISFCAVSAHASVYYVDRNHADADDLNPGTEQAPWTTIQHAADTLTAGDTVLIKAGTYPERIVPLNSGSDGNRIVYSAFTGDTVVVDGAGVSIPAGWGALVELSSVNHITVSGLTVQNAGVDDNHMGILAESCNSITIDNCRTYNTVGSGIAAWGSSYVAVTGNDVELACNDGEQECITVAGTDHFEIRGNQVHHSGPGTIGGEGIDVKDGASNGIIAGNHVHDLNRLGIYLDAWDKATANIEVTGNRVHDCLGSGFAVVSEAGGLLENIKIHNNLAYRNHYNGFNFGHYGEPASSRPLKNIQVVNNTFHANGTSGWGGGVYIESQDAETILIRNNICAYNVTFQILAETDVPLPQFTIDYNLIHGFRSEEGELRGENFVEGDPMFKDSSIGDYHLTEGSPAVDAGFADQAPADDFDGTGRPQGASIDIGAFEFGSAPSGITVDLTLSREIFLPGHVFLLTAGISNSGSETYAEQPFVVLLDVFGGYYWHPQWGHNFTYESLDIGLGTQVLEILNFVWPDVTNGATGVFFYGAILNQTFTEIIGEYDVVVFGWNPGNKAGKKDTIAIRDEYQDNYR